jgi:hypothetical protein
MAPAMTKDNSRSLRDDNQKNKGNCNGEATATAKQLQPATALRLGADCKG